MSETGNGVDKTSSATRDRHPELRAGSTVIAFGIACCAVAMLIVVAVAIAAA